MHGMSRDKPHASSQETREDRDVSDWLTFLFYIVMWFGLIAMLMVLVASVVWWRRP